MDNNVEWHRHILLESVAQRLQKNNFIVTVADTAAVSVQRILDLVEPSELVGFGGSVTVNQIGLIEKFEERAQAMLSQKPGMPRAEVLKLRRQSLLADVFIASPNAVTADGKLMFVDGIGNRAAAMLYGPKKVIAVAGWNKIVADEAAGRVRIDSYTAPVNAKRLGKKTPCAETGKCVDCSSPERICNIAVTLMKKPTYTEYYVILVAEALGY